MCVCIRGSHVCASSNVGQSRKDGGGRTSRLKQVSVEIWRKKNKQKKHLVQTTNYDYPFTFVFNNSGLYRSFILFCFIVCSLALSTLFVPQKTFFSFCDRLISVSALHPFSLIGTSSNLIKQTYETTFKYNLVCSTGKRNTPINE